MFGFLCIQYYTNTNCVEVLDRQASVFTTFRNSNGIMAFDKIVYSVEDLINHSIARNADYSSHVIVSQRLKDIFDKEKIKGVEFRLEG